MLKLCCFVPESHLDSVKMAMFDAGAGRIGQYEQCAWQTLGLGQFKPLGDANPFLGREGALEQVAEYNVEMVCEERFVEDAIKALHTAHPYETPAYEVYTLLNRPR